MDAEKKEKLVFLLLSGSAVDFEELFLMSRFWQN
jgi:hypothetical protein